MKKSFFLIWLVLLSLSLHAREFNDIKIDVASELARLIESKDTDRDHKITIMDKPETFVLRDKVKQEYQVSGHYHLSNLLQELTLLKEQKKDLLQGEFVFENPVERLNRSIRERFWDGLTRRIDKNHLSQVLPDSKTDSGTDRYIYVPYNDAVALAYYQQTAKEVPALKLQVVRLPKKITPQYVKSLNGKHGLLSLGLRKNSDGQLEGIPYVVPGGRFNEMYGWDSYFEALGLIVDGRLDLARAMVDNFVYQITHYGKILNANRSYYLTRSQPPFLTSMIRAVYQEMPKSDESKAWLKIAVLAALKEYQEVWMGEERLTVTGLSRYHGFGEGIPPEVEAGHYHPILETYAKKHKLTVAEFEKRFDQGKIQEPALEEFFLHDRAVRESGHDTTYRWRVEGKDACADFVTVDLNSLLYKMEIDLAILSKNELEDSLPLKAETLFERAQRRKLLIRTFLWDEKKNLFFDYNFKTKQKHDYLSATTFYPLWAFEPNMPEYNLLTAEEVFKLMQNALRELEAPGGVAATSQASLKLHGNPDHPRQWEYPNGWAPHQMIIWQGLKNYGQNEDAERLIYKWLYMITKNASDFNGTVPEKYDVVERSHAVFAEYGNVGTQFDYITREGFGWMNASYQVGLKELPVTLLPMLKQLKPYEEFKKVP